MLQSIKTAFDLRFISMKEFSWFFIKAGKSFFHLCTVIVPYFGHLVPIIGHSLNAKFYEKKTKKLRLM